jgi:hypothetical protein
MHVEDGGENTRGASWLHDADAHVSNIGRNGDPLLVHLRHGDWDGLDVVEYLSRAVGAELVQERRFRGSVRDLLRRRLEEVLAHDGLLVFGLLRRRTGQALRV